MRFRLDCRFLGTGDQGRNPICDELDDGWKLRPTARRLPAAGNQWTGFGNVRIGGIGSTGSSNCL